ncbi:MAG: hypothetical protein QOF53_3576, partial [Nocardioidaceae bacterium]|nr:hypothetical protein [Nocardioidaceae bacterium]
MSSPRTNASPSQVASGPPALSSATCRSENRWTLKRAWMARVRPELQPSASAVAQVDDAAGEPPLFEQLEVQPDPSGQP